jgi:ABC-type multidrug transport system ATPase subunit
VITTNADLELWRANEVKLRRRLSRCTDADRPLVTAQLREMQARCERGQREVEQQWVTRSPAKQQQIGGAIWEMGRAASERKRASTDSQRRSPAKRPAASSQQPCPQALDGLYVQAQYDDLSRLHRLQRQTGQRRESNAQPREGHEWEWMPNGAPWCTAADRLAHSTSIEKGIGAGAMVIHGAGMVGGLAKRMTDKHLALPTLVPAEGSTETGVPGAKIVHEAETDSSHHVSATEGKTAFDYERERVCFEFENLGLQVPTRNGPKTVLKGVSGKINSGQLVAVMGPSGCGKTTFMNALCGRAFYGESTPGAVLKINGGEDRIMRHRNRIGFVPQDDVVHDTLTVEETLWHSARLRMPASATEAERERVVEDTLRLLQIDHIRHSVVGSVEKRGISGGQRKRVNIGLELTCDPVVLFLDEPTSGLDSTSSEIVLSALKDMAKSGMTVITVIHQPRYSIYEQFDQVLLLFPGGQTVFSGKAEEALPYFTRLGFRLPPNDSPADFFMDVISGQLPRYDPAQRPSSSSRAASSSGSTTRSRASPSARRPTCTSSCLRCAGSPAAGATLSRSSSRARMRRSPRSSSPCSLVPSSRVSTRRWHLVAHQRWSFLPTRPSRRLL